MTRCNITKPISIPLQTPIHPSQHQSGLNLNSGRAPLLISHPNGAASPFDHFNTIKKLAAQYYQAEQKVLIYKARVADISGSRSITATFVYFDVNPLTDGEANM